MFSSSVWITVAILALVYGIRRPYAFDDAQYLLLAEELSEGNNPYKFKENKPPGTYVILAGWFRAFGHGPYSGRWYSWTTMLITAGIMSMVFRCEPTERVMTGLGTFLLLWFCEGSLVMTEAGVAFFGALALLALQREFCSSVRQFTAGAAFGIATMFKQPAMALPIIMGIVILNEVVARRQSPGTAFRVFAFHMAGYCLVVGGSLIVITSLGSFQQFWAQCVLGMMQYPRRPVASEWIVLIARTGWFAVPALLIVCARISRAQLLRDPPIFLFCVLAVISQCYALYVRAYAHYLMSAVPFLVAILFFGYQEYREQLRKLRFQFGPAPILTAACILLIFCGTFAWLKRGTIARLIRGNEVSPRELATRLAAYAPAKTDRALFLSRGVLGYHPSATYYYSGLRPPWPYLVLQGALTPAMKPWLDRLPSLIGDPSTKIVQFNPATRYDAFYYPIDEEIRDKIHAVLVANFHRPNDLNQSDIWVRTAPKAHAGSPSRGPFVSR